MDRLTPVRQQVHGSVMALLENGCVPWRLPLPHRGEGHLNFLSGHPYGGADPMLLGLALAERGGALPWWCTFAEARQAGLSPRRGAKGVHLGLARPRQGPGERLVVVFNASDLVGATFQERLARRRRLVLSHQRSRGERQWPGAKLGLGPWPLAVGQGSQRPADRSQDSRILPPRPRHVQDRAIDLASGGNDGGEWEAFISELAWSLMADRFGLSKPPGVYGLAASDWIQRLQEAPQTFFELLAEAGRVVDLLGAGGMGHERMC